jgi:hypothetical protein
MKRQLAWAGALLIAAAATNANIIHEWNFSDSAGTLMTGAANTGSVGGVSFAGGDAAWTTNGAGGLEIKSVSGTNLIQSNANMGSGINGIVSVQYDLSWNFTAAVPGVNREFFLISRTSSGDNPTGNQFRFAVSNFSGSQGGSGNIQIATTTAGAAGSGNYTNPVTIADLNTTPTGSVSLKATYTWNDDNTMLMDILAEYSLEGGANWTAMNLGGAFTPYAISDLGDLRIHGKGDFNDDNFYRFDAVTVTVVPEPATIAALLGLAALGFVAWRRRR